MPPERELRMLILDDDPDDVILLKDAIYDALEPTPVRLDHVIKSQDAEESLEEGRYDLAFFDYHLGMETGLDLLKRLDREGPLPCPIIILTGQGNEEVAVDAMKAGAADYVIKDVLNPDLIALTIRRALRTDEDRRRRREAEAALERLRRQYELILRSAGEGLMGLDRTGRITFVNPAAVSLTGLDEQRIKGRDAHRLLHRTGPGERCELDPCPLREAIERGKLRETTDDRFWRADGISMPVRYIVTPILEDGIRVGSVIAFSDTTVQRQAEEARRLATERLLELEHLKDIDRFRRQFLNTASHELNTPITPIKTQLHLMKRRGIDDLPEDHRHSLEIIDRNVDRLGRLVADLLDISRLQNDNLRLYQEDADVSLLVTTIVEDQRDPAEESGIDLEVSAQEPVVMRVDPQRLRQAVENLVTNAIKFTPKGGVVAVRTQADEDTLRIEVSDNGIGIPPEHISRLFRPFQHAHEGHARTGAGLGLSIARGIIEQHGGRIWAESDGADQGARFVIVLPRNEHAVEAMQEPAQAADDLWDLPGEGQEETDVQQEPETGRKDRSRRNHH